MKDEITIRLDNKVAQPFLAAYARRKEDDDPGFAAALLEALENNGYGNQGMPGHTIGDIQDRLDDLYEGYRDTSALSIEQRGAVQIFVEWAKTRLCVQTLPMD